MTGRRQFPPENDVERFIASEEALSLENKEQLRKLSKNLYRSYMNASDIDFIEDLKKKEFEINYCLKSQMGSNEYEHYVKLMNVKQFNTKERLFAWVERQESLAGVSFSVDLNIENYSNYCDE